jgi:predicted DNA-binding transcriptional regulator AlpA
MQDSSPNAAVRRVLTRGELKTRKGIPYSRAHLRRKINDGTFPPPFNLPDSLINLWFDDVIDDYLVACAEGRDWRSNGDEG